MSAHRLKYTGVLDLARLEDDIAVGQDDGLAEAAQPLEHREGSREQAVGEGVIHEKGGHGEQLDLARTLDAKTLEGADVIPIPQLGEEILKDGPVTIARGDAESF